MGQNFNTLLQTIRQYKLLSANDRVLVAVSGGADSLALLHWLTHHRALLSIELHVATLDHGIRAGSAGDADFVEAITQDWQIPVTRVMRDVPQYAKSERIGIEAAARNIRYQFLIETARQHNTTHIVTAHHADDQSETILMHIIRGSGVQGLRGMQMKMPLPQAPDLTLIRPLLHTRRAEIEAYCATHNLEPRIDPSNFDTSYRRNAIRHEILPLLREINPQVDNALTRLSDIATTENDFTNEVYQNNFRGYASFGERVTVGIDRITGWHIAMQRRFIQDALAHLGAEYSYDHIEHALNVISDRQVGAIAEFPGNVQLRIGYDVVSIEPADLPLPTEDYVQITEPIEMKVPGMTFAGDFKIIASETELPGYTARLSVPADAKIKLRTRQPGDRFMPQGLGGHSQKIKKWLIDNKIPSFVRDALPLVIISNTIAAIILPNGWRIAEPFAENETSQRIIYFKVEKML